MRIEEVNVTPVKAADGLIAFASVVIDGSLYLGYMAVHIRRDGTYRLVYPSKRVGNREMNIYHPIRKATGELIERAVMNKCQEVFERSDDYDRYDKTRHQAE